MVHEEAHEMSAIAQNWLKVVSLGEPVITHRVSLNKELKGMITPLRSRYQSVVEIAKNEGFDMHRIPTKYYILSDWHMGNDCVAMFDDTLLGDDEAMRWMKEQKGQEEGENDGKS